MNVRLCVVLCCVVLIGVTAAVTSVPPPTSSTPLRIDDLNHSVEGLLRGMPGVADVEVHQVNKPTHRIIHLRDWHFISKDLFAIDHHVEALNDEKLDQQYHNFLKQVDSLQLDQMTLLRTLIQQHGLKRLFCEGLTHRDMPNYREKIGVLKDMETNQIARLKRQLNEVRELLVGRPDPEAEVMEAKILDLLYGFYWRLVEMGAAGRLLVSGEIEEVLPVEDHELLDAANPITSDGQVQFDAEKVQARRDAIVQNMLKAGSFGLMILGGDHDLTENVKRVGEGKCEYIRVTLKRYNQVEEK